MGCCTHRKKQIQEVADQKWEYINLKDFKSSGCGTVFAYIWLWLMLITSVAVYAVDCFTAVNLLIFDRWSSKIDPAISFDIIKWIFSICIILSFLNLAYEGIRAIRVMRRGNVAECYLDSLAVRWESLRLGSGQGWRRFLVFAQLTKSKQGAQYIALFTYFNFQSWIRVIVCSGPRQVLNAFTLKSVYEAKLAINSQTVEGSISGFFNNIKILAEEDYQQALILSGMCFTLVIWVFSALFLLAAVLFWVFFLWHWIPNADGGLSGYCERKVTKELMKIVTKTVNKALAREEANRQRAEKKAAKKNGEIQPIGRMATLPTLPDLGPSDPKPGFSMMGRNDTVSTLPAYTSRPGTPGDYAEKKPILSRTATMMSTSTYASRTNVSPSYRSESPVPQVPTLPSFSHHQSLSGRGQDHPSRLNILPDRYTESPGPMHTDAPPPFPAPARVPGQFDFSPVDSLGADSSHARTYLPYNPNRSVPQTNTSWQPAQRFNSSRSAAGRPFPDPRRNMTAPVSRVPGSFPTQSNPSPTDVYYHDIESQRRDNW